MKSTNRTWQKHLRSKGLIPFFLDRLAAHALSSKWQHESGSFSFPVVNQEEDELTKAYFSMTEHFPYEFYIELTNKCNLNCVMCARSHMDRTEGIMSNDVFNKIIDEIVEKQPHAYIHFYGIGESLLDKKVFEKFEYAYRKGIRNSVCFTNGQLLMHKQNYKKLADSGLSMIGVDLDGFTQKVYEKIRVGGDFERVKKGIIALYRYIRENNISTRVEIAYQIYPEVNEHEIEPFIEWCNKNKYEYKLVTMHTWAGTRSDIPITDVDGLADQHRHTRKSACASLWKEFSITWNGEVALCFQDANCQEGIGNINDESIEGIWTSKYLEKRKEHIRGKYFGLCSQCDSNTEIILPDPKLGLYPESLGNF